MGKRIIRDRPLTDDEKATYREVRRQVAEELPDIRRRAKAAKPHIKLKQLLKALKKERERQGISLTELNERTGIDRGSLSKLENDDDPNVTIKTLIRYAEGIGKTVLVELGET